MYHIKSETLYTGEPTLKSVAYHEAGHALLARLTGRPIDTIALSQEGGTVVGFISNGREVSDAFNLVRSSNAVLAEPKELPDVPAGLRRQLAMRAACTSLAGLGAELLLNGHNHLTGPIVRNDNDHAKARAVLRDAFGFDHLHYTQLTTHFYLEKHWPEVCVTAKALLARCEYSGEAVLRQDDPAHAVHFSRKFENAGWRDESWD